MTDWVRLWHDMPTDPKWRVVARKSGQPLTCVIALFNLIMVNASGNAEKRGTLRNWDSEDAAAALDMDVEQVEAIMCAMVGKVIDEDDNLTGWEKRQPKREDSGVGARVARYRETKRNEAKRNVTQGNAPETETETETETDYSVDKSTGASAPLPDADKQFWDTAKTYLQRTGVKNPGALVGKWARDHGKTETAQAITKAQLERPVEAVAFIEGCFRQTRAVQPTVPL